MDLNEARVWVTGASSGIGAALVPALRARGGRVAISARRRDLLESLATESRRASGEFLVAGVDVTDRQLRRATSGQRRHAAPSREGRTARPAV